MIINVLKCFLYCLFCKYTAHESAGLSIAPEILTVRITATKYERAIGPRAYAGNTLNAVTRILVPNIS